EIASATRRVCNQGNPQEPVRRRMRALNRDLIVLLPAASCTALTGRTHGCRPACKREETRANSEPPTHSIAAAHWDASIQKQSKRSAHKNTAGRGARVPHAV